MKITLEQWLTFKTVVDEGSYASAAEVLNKSQSSISYSMQQMALHLASPVLELQGRKAVITAAGQTLYRHAEDLLKHASTMERIAEDMAAGVEDSVTLALDALAPRDPIFEALQSLAEQYPRTRVKVLETTLSGTDEALLSGGAHVAVMAKVPPGFLADPLMPVKMVAVASKKHPLATLSRTSGEVTEADLSAARQIVIRDSGQKREQNAGWLGAYQRWTFSHFATSIYAVEMGLGFAFLPEHFIVEQLQSGKLVRLALRPNGERHLSLSLVQASHRASGPAETALANALRHSFKKTSYQENTL